jgi:uncharacterized ferritin-like protein (DUF455 family)
MACLFQAYLCLSCSRDIIYGAADRGLPHTFFSDRAGVAEDELERFALLTERLVVVSPSTRYSSLVSSDLRWPLGINSSHLLFSAIEA